MNKIALIIRREYLTRVRKKSFIIMSIVGPLLFGLIFVIPIWLASREGDEKIVEVHIVQHRMFLSIIDDKLILYLSRNFNRGPFRRLSEQQVITLCDIRPIVIVDNYNIVRPGDFHVRRDA